MAKGSILMGKQTGKLGQSVLSTRYGEQIQRAYVGTIANPKTEAQVATRSRFKLASQLSAVMADVIAIPRVGSKTGRNQFVSATMDITSEAAGVAQVNLNAVQLTKSQRGLIGFTATRDTANDKISVALKGANGSELSRVVYVAFEKQNDGSLVQLASQVVSSPGDNNTFPADLKGTTKSIVVYAYGIKDKDGATSVKFGNLNAPTAEQVAKLLTTSTDTLSGVMLTRTNGATMNEGINSADSDDSSMLPPIFRNVSISNISWDRNITEQPAGGTSIRGSVEYARSLWHAALIQPGVDAPVLDNIYTIDTDLHLVVNDGFGNFDTVAELIQESNYWLVAGPVPENGKIKAELIYPYFYGTAGGA